MNAPSPAPHQSWPARLVQLATVVVVAAVAAATFVLSYDGVHAIALQSGVPKELARFYPPVFDAVLVIACAAVPLRTRWLTRAYTWLVIIVVVGILGALDAVHAMNVTIPRRAAAGTAAVLPWALLLLAFSLWLLIVRHFRGQDVGEDAAPRSAGADLPDPTGLPALPALPAAGEAAGPPPGDPGDFDDPDGLAAELDDTDLNDAADLNDLAVEAGMGEAGPDVTDEGAGDPAGPSPEPPGEGAGEQAIPEVPGVPYATGPRLHRVRSLPAPPVDDGDDEAGQRDGE
jgi:hypothetical protein